MAQAAGFRPEQGVDLYFMQRASQAGKPVAGLETIEAQLGAMDAVPYPEQAHDLGKFLDDPRKALQELTELHAIWRAGDATELDRLLREQMAEDTPDTYRLLIVNRNDDWIPAITERLTDSKVDDTLVVVGAAHLTGQDGLVEKMRAKGYKVERIGAADR
jgi:uncharacterized protein YbaP (TraB family)